MGTGQIAGTSQMSYCLADSELLPSRLAMRSTNTNWYIIVSVNNLQTNEAKIMCVCVMGGWVSCFTLKF